MSDTPSYRHDPPGAADERSTLVSFLDYHRATLRWKCEGLTPEQLSLSPMPPSSLSLLGLLRHLAEVERSWFHRVAGESFVPLYYSEDDPDGDFDNVAPDEQLVDSAWADWRASIKYSDDVITRTPLDHSFVRVHNDESLSLRWVLVHMIEEYARHNGHADLLRERIDGATGE